MADADVPPSRRIPPGRVSRRSLGVFALAGVAALALVVAWRSFAPTACAAIQVPQAATTSGRATFYDLAGGIGNCSYAAPSDGLYVALPPGEYAAAAKCGGYLSVSGPKGTVRAKVIDQCPECEAGHVDLSRTAFARIADPVQGIVPVTYRTVVNPALPGPLGIRVKEGSSQWWLAILVSNHGNPLRSVRVLRDGSWMSLRRTDYNYWLAEHGAGTGPFTVRVTDVQGHTATLPGIALLPGEVQRTTIRMYGAGSGGGATGTTPAPTTRGPSPRPTTPVTTPVTTLSTTPVMTPAAAAQLTTDAPTPRAEASDVAQPGCS